MRVSKGFALSHKQPVCTERARSFQTNRPHDRREDFCNPLSFSGAVSHMKICLIGKYFPIQGGVSKDTQWLSDVLAQAGFTVHIVTNADEVEPQYRCLNWSPPPFTGLNTGSIILHSSSRAARRHYIPYGNPFITKLATIATDVIRTYQCDLIYCYYLEPYAMAGYLASQWTGVPYGIRHAGSDIGSLFQSPELQTAYRQIMLAADYVVATPATFRRFLHLGVEKDRLYLPSRSSLPTAYFSPDTAPLDVNAFLAWMNETCSHDPYYAVFRRFSSKSFDPSVPTIGIYGKIGQTKGSFDLLQALARLHSQGKMFNFLALTQGNAQILADFAAGIEDNGLSEVTWLLPFLPHWNVPQFLRACTAVCFLERDFPIPIHTPLIPREVFACGTCLLLSHEIAEKQSYRQKLQHGSNVFLVDPHDHDALAELLERVIQNPIASRDVGQKGYHEISLVMEDFSRYAHEWPQLFRTILADIQQRNAHMSIAEMQACLARLYTEDTFRQFFEVAPEASLQDYLLTEDEKHALMALDKKLLGYFATSLKMKQEEHLRSAYPATFQLSEVFLRRYCNRFYQLYPAKPHEDLIKRMIDFGEFMEQCLARDDSAPGYASEVVRYERLHYATTYLPTSQDAFTAINEQEKAHTLFHLESILVVTAGIQIEPFTYDVIQIVNTLQMQRPLEDPQPGQYSFLFQRRTHSLTTNVFALNSATVHLLSLCDGTHTIATMIREAEQQLQRTGLENDIVATLNALGEQRIVEDKMYE
jgi:glycosyltransferase involved in cell wall biosynthesis